MTVVTAASELVRAGVGSTGVILIDELAVKVVLVEIVGSPFTDVIDDNKMEWSTAVIQKAIDKYIYICTPYST